MSIIVIETKSKPDIVEIYNTRQGPQGPKGADGVSASDGIILTAAVALGGQRVIATDDSGRAIYADSSSLEHFFRVAGISTGAASQDAEITIRNFGPMSEGSWTWTPDEPIYFTSTGVLTQTIPLDAAFIQVVAVATSATAIFVNLQTPIEV